MRLLVLGRGSIGSRHIKNLTELGHNVRSWDIASNDIKDRETIIRWTDAVVIATPTSQHYQDILDCQRFTRLIFCEKPLVSNRLEWRALELDHITMVGYNLRFHSCVKRAKQILGQGLIGKPIWADFVCGQLNNKPAYRRDGVILNWSHEIDLAYHLLGYAEVQRCSANEDESTADLYLTHANHGCKTRVTLDYLSTPERRVFLISGDSGILEVDLVKRHLFVTNNDGDLIESFAGRDSFNGNYLDEMRKFIDRCQGKETVPIGCTAQEAFIVMNLCLTAKELAREGQKDRGDSPGPHGVNPAPGQGHDELGRPAGPQVDHQRFEPGQAD